MIITPHSLVCTFYCSYISFYCFLRYKYFLLFTVQRRAHSQAWRCRNPVLREQEQSADTVRRAIAREEPGMLEHEEVRSTLMVRDGSIVSIPAFDAVIIPGIDDIHLDLDVSSESAACTTIMMIWWGTVTPVVVALFGCGTGESRTAVVFVLGHDIMQDSQLMLMRLVEDEITYIVISFSFNPEPPRSVTPHFWCIIPYHVVEY